ncbi:hypothetical protein IAT38_004450 [Cryptococcus sp. DSM 104549]
MTPAMQAHQARIYLKEHCATGTDPVFDKEGKQKAQHRADIGITLQPATHAPYHILPSSHDVAKYGLQPYVWPVDTKFGGVHPKGAKRARCNASSVQDANGKDCAECVDGVHQAFVYQHPDVRSCWRARLNGFPTVIRGWNTSDNSYTIKLTACYSCWLHGRPSECDLDGMTLSATAEFMEAGVNGDKQAEKRRRANNARALDTAIAIKKRRLLSYHDIDDDIDDNNSSAVKGGMRMITYVDGGNETNAGRGNAVVVAMKCVEGRGAYDDLH